MDRGKNFSKLSGGFSLPKIRDGLKKIEPVLHTIEQVASAIDTVNKTVIIPSIPIIKAGIKLSGGEKKVNKDPAHRLRILAMKAKKVMVGNGCEKKGGKYKTGLEPEIEPEKQSEGSGFSSGKGLGKYLNKLPKDILTLVARLHNEGLLIPILKIAQHL